MLSIHLTQKSDSVYHTGAAVVIDFLTETLFFVAGATLGPVSHCTAWNRLTDRLLKIEEWHCVSLSVAGELLKTEFAQVGEQGNSMQRV